MRISNGSANNEAATRPVCRPRSVFAAAACAALLLAGCEANSGNGPDNFSGDPRRGAALIKQHGCGGCHLIPNVADATGNVGPPLTRIGTRTFIAGFINNSPENMALWIRDPQRILPGNAMPRMDISPNDARDITAFLYTLK
jgi:cytochrome c